MLVFQRDAVQRKLDIAMDAATEGGAGAHAWGAHRIAALQIELERHAVAIGTMEEKPRRLR